MKDSNKIDLMNIYRIQSATGEVFLHIPSTYYLHNEKEYDRRKYHYFQRFQSEVNTSISNITGFELSSYNRKENKFIDNNGDGIIYFVGAVTMREWDILLDCFGEANCETPVQAALEVIKYHTGVDRLKQITTGDHGPGYWDDDSEDEPFSLPAEKGFFVKKIEEMLGG